MEPRAVARGNACELSEEMGRASRFKWSHVQSHVETSTVRSSPGCAPSFNGATCRRTWKHHLVDRGQHIDKELQWSHVQSHVETSARRAR